MSSIGPVASALLAWLNTIVLVVLFREHIPTWYFVSCVLAAGAGVVYAGYALWHLLVTDFEQGMRGISSQE